MSDSHYPRLLFRGDQTSRAHSRDELLAKRAQGWRARLLPGEAPEDIGEEALPPHAPPSDPPPSTGTPDPPQEPDEFEVPKRRGRPRKE